MKVVAVLESKDGRKLRAASRRRREGPAELEPYYSPGQEIAVYCSTNEREEFERDTGEDLRQDVLTAKEFSALAQWLSENAELRCAGIYSAA